MKSLTYLLLVLVLLACGESDVKDINRSNDNAAFAFDQVQVVAFDTRPSDPNWPDLKDKALVSLRTCVQDSQYQQPIVGENFEIISQNATSTSRSNTNGCISWSEEFNYNYLANEAYIEISGVMEGKDNFKGRRTYSVALNPWLRQASDLNFSRYQRVVSLADAAIVSDLDNHIETRNYNIVVKEKIFSATQTSLTLEITTNPELLRHGLDGGLLKEPLTGGTFNMQFLMVARSGSGERTVLADSSRTVRVGRDGQIRTEVDFNLTAGVNPQDEIELGVKITSADPSRDLGYDEGLIELGVLDGTISRELSNDTGVPLSLLLALKNNDNAVDENPDNFGFIIETVRIDRKSETGNNLSSTSSHSTVEAEFTVPMVSPVVHEPIRNHNFQLTLIDQETNQTVFDDRISTQTGTGNLVFRTSFDFRRYNQRRWKPYLLRISSEDAPYVDVTKERVVYVNPWISTSDFGIDSNVATPPESSSENNTEIYISGFNYRIDGDIPSSFSVNKSLDLKFNKQINLRFRPKLKMDHDFTGGDTASYPPIVNGTYNIRFLLLSPNSSTDFDGTQDVDLSQFHTLTAGESEARVQNGMVDVDIDFPLLFTDYPLYSGKNVVLIEMRSTERDSELRPGYFVGHFTGYQGSGRVETSEANFMRLTTGNLDIAQDLISRISNVRRKLENIDTTTNFLNIFVGELRKITPMVPAFDHRNFRLGEVRSQVQYWSTQNSFKRLTNARSSAASLDQMILEASIPVNSTLSSDICKVMFNKNERTVETVTYAGASMGYNPPVEFVTVGMHYEECKKNPGAYLSLDRLEHVVRVLGNVRNDRVDNTNSISRSQAYFISRGQTFFAQTGIRESEYFQHGWHVGAGVEAGKFGMFLAGDYGAQGGYRRDLYTMNADSEQLGNLRRIINQDGLRLPYTRYDMSFDLRTKTCLFITGKPVEIELPIRHRTSHMLSWLTDREPPRGVIQSPKRLYICSDTIRNRRKSESYYFVRSEIKPNGNGDGALTRNSMVNVIRGRRNFEKFRELQIESDRALVIHENDDSSVVQSYQNYVRNRATDTLRYKDRMGVGFPGLIE
tara:strand:+ start:21172 stop:24390 length:3219 start_codon:yes stop_codon:yes gene_type:complete